MHLRCSEFLNLANVFFIFSFIIGAKSTKYPLNEIDNALAKFIKRERYYRPLDEELGCWPQRIIPYFINNGFSPDQIQHIYRHIYQIQNRTCLRWVESKIMSGVKKHVEFLRRRHDPYDCYTSEFGDSGTVYGIISLISLGDQCFPTESVIHEMMHSLGFTHEHQRIDRDCYVVVDEEHARSEQDLKIIYDDFAFEKWPYDKRSVTHYTRLTNILKDRDEPFLGIPYKLRLGDSYGWWGKIGKRYGKLTQLDVYKINYRYCGAPDFCETQAEVCKEIEEEENRDGCKKLYVDIAKGTAEPSKP